MCELHPEHARSAARTAIGYSQAFDGKGIDWQNGQPWPHRIELAQALDWITELGALALNLADRVESGETEITRLRADLDASQAECERLRADAERLDHIERLRLRSIEKGYLWDSFEYDCSIQSKTVRKQIDAARAGKVE